MIGEDDDDDSSSSYSSSYDSPDFGNDGNDALVATLTDQTADEEDDLATSLLAAYQEQSENLRGLTESAKNLGKKQRREIQSGIRQVNEANGTLTMSIGLRPKRPATILCIVMPALLTTLGKAWGTGKRRESGAQDHLPQEGGAND